MTSILFGKGWNYGKQLDKKKIFFQFFASFIKSTSNIEHLGKKMSLIAYVFQILETAKDVAS